VVISQPERTVALFHAEFQSGQLGNRPKIVEALRMRASDPSWTEAISRCTQIAATGGDLETAETLFSFISATQPSRWAAGYELARLRYKRGQVQAAQELVSQLADASRKDANMGRLPRQAERYEDLVLLQLELGRTSDARSLVNRLIATVPDNPRTWVLKANIELRSNDFREALKSYTQASNLDRSNADAVLGIVSIHALSGSSDSAMSEYKAGIERFPNDPRFYIAFATALLSSPNAPQASPQIKSLLLKAAKLDPRSPDVHYQLGQLALKQGQLSEAKTEFLAALEADPNRSSAHFALSLTYRRLGQAEHAAKHFAIYQKLKQAEDREMPMSNQAMTKP
jgi:tetratricopeptide (TPR) repeat protein